ncbi:MAG: hypothetical protein AAFR71_02655 [Pseudomonadota bacterium]
MANALDYVVEMRDANDNVIECFAKLESFHATKLVFEHYAQKHPNQHILGRHKARVIFEREAD